MSFVCIEYHGLRILWHGQGRCDSITGPTFDSTDLKGSPMSISAEVATLFLDELAKRNLDVKLDEEGNYTLHACGLSITVSLENVSRDFERDRDPDHVIRFVETITNVLVLPDWQKAEGRLRWQPEPADHKFGDTLRDAVSDK